MTLRSSPWYLSSLLLVACASVQPTPSPATPSAPAATTDDKTGAKPEPKPEELKAKADAKKQKQKELRAKQRELQALAVENEIAEVDRTVRQLNVDAALAKTAIEMAQAKKSLDSFLNELKPRELEQKRIQLDQSTWHAEHQKDELGELTAMYEADEFARTTKELVLKRGRRDVEAAERHLAVAKKELAHFETVSLADRERELRQKVTDTELERKKAELEAQKVKVEFALAIEKSKLREQDLKEDIADLEQKLAEDKS